MKKKIVINRMKYIDTLIIQVGFWEMHCFGIVDNTIDLFNLSMFTNFIQLKTTQNKVEICENG